MPYLEYEKTTKQVVQIHENVPASHEYYNVVFTDDFKVGDEFEFTIWINEVNEEGNLISHSAIRNNPNATRLLEENYQLKLDNEKLKREDLNNKEAIAELYLMTTGGTL